jgi:hypothetical protein
MPDGGGTVDWCQVGHGWILVVSDVEVVRWRVEAGDRGVSSAFGSWISAHSDEDGRVEEFSLASLQEHWSELTVSELMEAQSK